MKIPYIKIRQRSEIFYVTKLNVDFLKEHVDFHFRDPYSHFTSKQAIETYDDYISKLKRKGLNLKSSEEGIQRRLQTNRINEITKYIQSSVSNFFPNSILLSVNVAQISNFDEQYLNYEMEEIGFFEFPDEIRFTVIDGQHRLAGLFLAVNGNKDRLFPAEEIDFFEMPAVLLFNVSISTAAKLFADINGKQKPVNRSLIYDLYEEVNLDELNELKKFHHICLVFYTDKNSPLFRQIKMLGIGSGAISQSFFIDYSIAAVKKTDLKGKSSQDIYNQFFYYFKAYQRIFPEDWPVPEKFDTFNDIDSHARRTLKQRKSQLVKTNGFGAIMRVFPEVYSASGGTYKGYLDLIKKLKNKISWIPEARHGTGKAFQNYLVTEINSILFG